MAMLAERKRKQKWSLNPRGKQWSEDSSKFGQKMLEKMGWTSGKGLGANEQGPTEHVRVKLKNDQAGIGFNPSDADKEWTHHQEGFSQFLKQLQESNQEEIIKHKENDESELSGQSLELKSKQSRARVHYQKFTRGKDVNRYSAKDLANIFGKKELNESRKGSDSSKEVTNNTFEPVGTCENRGGVITIKGGSMSDYFKNKMSTYKIENQRSNGEWNNREDSESETECRVGFGFSSVTEAPKVIEKSDAYKESTKVRKENYVFENQGLDLEYPENTGDASETSKYAFENPCINFENTSTGKTEENYGIENEGLDLESTERTEHVLGTSKFSSKNICLSTEENTVGKRKRNCVFENRELDVEQTDGKSSRKRRKQENGFTNEALNLESPAPETQAGTEFEVSRLKLKGVENIALDLSDEEKRGKKRVTFNDKVEYTSIERKKKKKSKRNKEMLDKFEVENEKIKKKKKKKRKIESDVENTGIVNEALSVDIQSDESNDNEINERKSKKAKRRKNRRMSNLETIQEVPNEEEVSIEGVPVETANNAEEVSKKKKKKQKQNVEVKPVVVEEKNESLEQTENVDQKRWKKGTNTKQLILSLLNKGHSVDFKGSNINDIKGYGLPESD